MSVPGAILARAWRMCECTGEMLQLAWRTFVEIPSVRFHPGRFNDQAARAGGDSLPIAMAMAFFTGLVLALHSGIALRGFRAETELARIVANSLVKELGPILTGMMLAGRVGAAIAAEVGTMSVNEEIDALHTLGISPIRYLAAPRFLALTLMLPLLIVYADIVGIVGGAFMAKAQFGISYEYYNRTVVDALTAKDIIEGLIKGAFFGGIISTVACFYGFKTRGGAEGVGKAITRSVVTSFVALFICDYFITRLMNY